MSMKGELHLLFTFDIIISFSDAAYFIDAMSSFGAVPVNVKDCNVDYLVSSANKCIEGVPGFSFAICRTGHLLSCKGDFFIQFILLLAVTC